MIVGTSTSCSTSCGSRKTARTGKSSGKILGTSITCSGSGMSASKELQDIRKLFHHLRRRIVESQQRRDRIDNLLQGTPLCPLLRPGQGRKPVRPRPAGLFFVGAERAPTGVWEVPDRGRVVHLAPPHPGWHSSVLVRNGAYSLPGPLRRSSAHVPAMSGTVAADVTVQLLKRAAR